MVGDTDRRSFMLTDGLLLMRWRLARRSVIEGYGRGVRRKGRPALFIAVPRTRMPCCAACFRFREGAGGGGEGREETSLSAV